MSLREIFAANLRALREQKGYSQEALAHEAGIDRTYISSLEKCRYSASLDMVERIAQTLDVPPETLIRPPKVD